MSYYHAIYHAMFYFAIHHATILKAGMAWCKEQILVDKAIIKVAHAASPRCFAKLSDKICNKMQISNMLSLKTSSLPFKSCQLVAFIVKCNIIMFLWLPLTLYLNIWMCYVNMYGSDAMSQHTSQFSGLLPAQFEAKFSRAFTFEIDHIQAMLNPPRFVCQASTFQGEALITEYACSTLENLICFFLKYIFHGLCWTLKCFLCAGVFPLKWRKQSFLTNTFEKPPIK